MKKWVFKDEISRINSKWVTVFCEQWLDETGAELEYWRVEKDDSVIVVPIQNKQIICAAPYFRPGIKGPGLDFPGGRLNANKTRKEVVCSILLRELGIPEQNILTITPLNKDKWVINSSFSNQGLWSFTATIDPNFEISSSKVGARERADLEGANALLKKLNCLQCRAVLQEWKEGLS
jgi:hypothetical protein